MPHMQAFVERLNTRFNKANIGNVDVSLLLPGETVTNAAMKSTHGPGAITASVAEANYIATHFTAMGAGGNSELENLREILQWAVGQNPRVPVQFLWVPAEDPPGEFHIKYWAVRGLPATADMPQSEGGISVLLSGPTNAEVSKNAVPKWWA